MTHQPLALASQLESYAPCILNVIWHGPRVYALLVKRLAINTGPLLVLETICRENRISLSIID